MDTGTGSDLEIPQQYCLRWNNYIPTVHHIFHKHYVESTFVDVTLVVENQNIKCHRLVLSACSTYFDRILMEYKTNTHPIIILQDISYQIMDALVSFMYLGEIKVSKAHLEELLSVADSLLIKGLAGAKALNTYTKYKYVSPGITKVTSSTGTSEETVEYPITTQPQTTSYQNFSNGLASLPRRPPLQAVLSPFNIKALQQTNINFNNIPLLQYRKAPTSPSPPPSKKRKYSTGTRSPSTMSPSPRSNDELFQQEVNRISPALANRIASPALFKSVCPALLNSVSPALLNRAMQAQVEFNVEQDEEDCERELQIDESAGQSEYDSGESDYQSRQNTPGPVMLSREMHEKIETARTLTNLSSGVLPGHNLFLPAQSQTLLNSNCINIACASPSPPPPEHEIPTTSIAGTSSTVARPRKSGGARNGERHYTIKDLDDGIECVIDGSLTPANAIKHYNVPRRTFFRKLAVVRDLRGIKTKKVASQSQTRGKAKPKKPSARDAKENQAGPSRCSPTMVPIENNILNNNNQIIFKPSEPLSVKEDTNLNTQLAVNNENVLSLLTGSYAYHNYLKLINPKKDNNKESANISDNSSDKENPKPLRTYSQILTKTETISPPKIDETPKAEDAQMITSKIENPPPKISNGPA